MGDSLSRVLPPPRIRQARPRRGRVGRGRRHGRLPGPDAPGRRRQVDPPREDPSRPPPPLGLVPPPLVVRAGALLLPAPRLPLRDSAPADGLPALRRPDREGRPSLDGRPGRLRPDLHRGREHRGRGGGPPGLFRRGRPARRGVRRRRPGLLRRRRVDPPRGVGDGGRGPPRGPVAPAFGIPDPRRRDLGGLPRASRAGPSPGAAPGTSALPGAGRAGRARFPVRGHGPGSPGPLPRLHRPGHLAPRRDRSPGGAAALPRRGARRRGLLRGVPHLGGRPAEAASRRAGAAGGLPGPRLLLREELGRRAAPPAQPRPPRPDARDPLARPLVPRARGADRPVRRAFHRDLRRPGPPGDRRRGDDRGRGLPRSAPCRARVDDPRAHPHREAHLHRQQRRGPRRIRRRGRGPRRRADRGPEGRGGRGAARGDVARIAAGAPAAEGGEPRVHRGEDLPPPAVARPDAVPVRSSPG